MNAAELIEHSDGTLGAVLNPNTDISLGEQEWIAWDGALAGTIRPRPVGELPRIVGSEPIRPRCYVCDAPAKCFGRHEESPTIQFGCDTHCGHGDEDGWCKTIEELGWPSAEAST